MAILLLAVIHAFCDYVKARFTRDEWFAFTIDQVAHFAAIALAGIWLSSGGWDNVRIGLRTVAGSQKLYLFLCVYTAVVFGGGYFVQKSLSIS